MNKKKIVVVIALAGVAFYAWKMYKKQNPTTVGQCKGAINTMKTSDVIALVGVAVTAFLVFKKDDTKISVTTPDILVQNGVAGDAQNSDSLTAKLASDNGVANDFTTFSTPIYDKDGKVPTSKLPDNQQYYYDVTKDADGKEVKTLKPVYIVQVQQHNKDEKNLHYKTE